MKLPGQLQGELTLKAVWLAVVAAVFLLVAGFGVYQYTMRHGFQFLFWKHEGEIARAERLEGEIKALVDASIEAEKLQKAVNAAKEQTYKDIAEAIDNDHDQASAAAVSATEQYIAAHRVRPEAAGCPRSEAGPAAQGGGASVPAPVPADTLVAISDADVRTCSAAAAYANSAHAWAVELNATNAK